MASGQQVQRKLSLMLSEVLDEIGVNSEKIARKRQFALILESLNEEPSLNVDGQSVHFFGSLDDGSSTTGMRYDDSIMICSHHVIQELADWKPATTNLLMVRDENTSPGYCLLQLLRNDAPLATTNIPSIQYYIDDKERVLLKTTCQTESLTTLLPTAADTTQLQVRRHTPDNSSETDIVSAPLPMVADMTHFKGTATDIVPALRCERWPVEAEPWLNRTSNSGWPGRELKYKAAQSGCFLVPVGSRVGRYSLAGVEWRISMASAEKMLMFSLNITQMKCYVLVKILMRSRFYGVYGYAITSYICKTALFHCIENADTEVWQEDNLIFCLTPILGELHKYFLNENCPHFIIPENNLMAGRISPEEKQHLLANLEYVIQNIVTALLQLRTDDIGLRLHQKMNAILEESNGVHGECKHSYFSVSSIIGFIKRPLKFLYWCCVVYSWAVDV